MNNIYKIGVAALMIGSALAAQAQTSDDAARRARNRDEAIAHHNGLPSATSRNDYTPASRDESMRARTHRGADKTRGFTHRQLTKVRDFGARTNAKYPARKHGVEDPNKAPSALGK